MKARFNLSAVLLASTALLALGGCASGPGEPPTAALEQAEYAVGTATESKASRYAELQMYHARQELQQAQRLLNQEEPTHADYVKARQLAQKATVDAQLAIAIAEAKQAQKQAQEVQAGLRRLKSRVYGVEEQP
ncbi:MAG: DUF4398 domain-containing protein [Gammaproteobacteria bacterium]|nr:DUF4398 domain-containing protein [Gammaproteobacteria bacterium]